MATQSPTINNSLNMSPAYFKQLRRFTVGSLITLFASLILMVYLSPFAYMVVTSFQDEGSDYR